tara:strand:+ start:1403 stop:1666 length:264 start_codon:yes stop_codon:yes gene_type:complete
MFCRASFTKAEKELIDEDVVIVDRVTSKETAWGNRGNITIKTKVRMKNKYLAPAALNSLGDEPPLLVSKPLFHRDNRLLIRDNLGPV